jgi:hypothetical protein
LRRYWREGGSSLVADADNQINGNDATLEAVKRVQDGQLPPKHWNVIRLDSACEPLADEQQKPKRAHDKLDRQKEEEDATWHAIDDHAEKSPDGKRVGEERRPDHCHVPQENTHL